ncbi:MalY/PatB family protein [Methanosphaera sp. WGK6]|uniref:MalY/PatB family protein n=1 Tax=Methanosphaera sp. WGK6 TaxID=1561964 RepID=UPI00084CE2A5|nr:MalY/PatB family protein [Methanosphaera sp. WGK6]OED29632.1 cystathionine beta-lyase [Methanosphaera sp. WGK6]
MITYNFNQKLNRKNTNSLKWDLFDSELPMWVADMDFSLAPEIREALQKTTTMDVLGYTIIPDEWYEAYINWWKKYNLELEKPWLKFATGVMPAISTIIKKLTNENDKILIQTPVYHMFFHVIENNNRQVIENKLKYENNKYSIDFKDLEEKLENPDVKLMLLCNPHNPVGKIWTKEELEKIGQLAYNHNVIVVADEIHCDLTNPGKTYIPFSSINKINQENSITTIAPTKTFNIAGLKTSAISIPSRNIREKVFNAIDTDGLGEANIFAINGTIAAYNNAGNWLKNLRQYLYENKQYVNKYLKEEIPEITMIKSDATYLLWLDCSKLNIDSRKFNKLLIEKTGLQISPGRDFGINGDSFIRINIACPQEQLKDGLNRLKRGVEIHKRGDYK